ncbi:LOW QUALITY PROTEIN: swi5-dependent recombination DNA repair protein 1 homolog [Peromyscus leucopus]|uniref:LOW QUALITY PROTEIN: swi5-dependent recombination DNA repair protein 1 homolog n=1 Tax=Peromyscus leucopus TaxID=10041 RepID=UPI0018859801|nr:LOW QUALITY PROTEIN: swi5-dependent recombination DNA repair protein 1 homolog [Peromyscus leucopus]
MADKEGNQEFAPKMEGPSDSASIKKESSSDSASIKMESASDSASIKMESASDLTSIKKESASDSASIKMESVSDSASIKKESSSDSASIKKESASDSVSIKMEIASDSVSIKKESSSDSASIKKESASDSVSIKKESCIRFNIHQEGERIRFSIHQMEIASDSASIKEIASDSASIKMESTSDSTSIKKESTSDSASIKMESTSDSASIKKESTSNSASIKMESASDSASIKKESSLDSASTLPDTPEMNENPPSLKTNISGKQPMSGTLKERLKKTRSSSHSFCSVVKRLKVENEEKEIFSEPGASSKEESCSEFQESLKHIDNGSEKDSSENINTCKSKSLDTGSSSAPQNESVNENTKERLKEEKAKLAKQVQEKEDLLRRLKLVKMYRIKNNLSELEMLIKKWRKCSQQLLYELQSVMSEDDEKLSLTELIDYYGVDETVVHYNRSEEEFTGV